VSRPTLLLVTGHPQLLYLITRYGEQSGCLVVGAETVDGAVALLGRERPAAVLLHLLPWPDESWEALRRLKASPAAAGIPITIISALADEARARDEGAAHWLWQPVMYADFLAALSATAALPQPRETER
jgi:putative two-component system response regulator